VLLVVFGHRRQWWQRAQQKGKVAIIGAQKVLRRSLSSIAATIDDNDDEEESRGEPRELLDVADATGSDDDSEFEAVDDVFPDAGPSVATDDAPDGTTVWMLLNCGAVTISCTRVEPEGLTREDAREMHRDRLCLLFSAVALFLLLATFEGTRYYTGFTDRVETRLDIDRGYISMSPFRRIFEIWDVVFVFSICAAICTALGGVLFFATRKYSPHAHRVGTARLLQLCALAALWATIFYALLPAFQNAVVLRSDVSSSNATDSFDVVAIYTEAASGQAFLVKEVLIDRWNSFLIQIAFAASLACHLAMVRTHNLLATRSRGIRFRGILPRFSRLELDGDSAMRFAVIRTISATTIFALHLGAMFCAVAIFQGITKSRFAKYAFAVAFLGTAFLNTVVLIIYPRGQPFVITVLQLFMPMVVLWMDTLGSRLEDEECASLAVAFFCSLAILWAAALYLYEAAASAVVEDCRAAVRTSSVVAAGWLFLVIIIVGNNYGFGGQTLVVESFTIAVGAAAATVAYVYTKFDLGERYALLFSQLNAMAVDPCQIGAPVRRAVYEGSDDEPSPPSVCGMFTGVHETTCARAVDTWLDTSALCTHAGELGTVGRTAVAIVEATVVAVVILVDSLLWIPIDIVIDVITTSTLALTLLMSMLSRESQERRGPSLQRTTVNNVYEDDDAMLTLPSPEPHDREREAVLARPAVKHGARVAAVHGVVLCIAHRLEFAVLWLVWLVVYLIARRLAALAFAAGSIIARFGSICSPDINFTGRVKLSMTFTTLAFLLFMFGVVQDGLDVWQSDYGAKFVQNLLRSHGLVIDSSFRGLDDTEAAWADAARTSWCLEFAVAMLLLVVVLLEMFGRFVLADRIAIILFGMDIVANVLPTLINFESTLGIPAILQSMSCAPQINLMFAAMVSGAFGQATQFLVGVRLGPIILSTSVAILRAAHLSAMSSDHASDRLRPHLLRGSVQLFRYGSMLAVAISSPIFLMMSAYTNDGVMKVLVLSFWLLPLASAQLYTGAEATRNGVYVLSVWILYVGTLSALLLYAMTLEYGNVWHVLHMLVSSTSFWRWFVREIAEVLIGLRVLGQLTYSGLHP
jgi:hypothetical protein